MKVLNWIWARLQEPSTWAGIGLAASAMSMSLQSNSSLAVAVLAGITAVALPEGRNK
jgi:hypothetical protein